MRTLLLIAVAVTLSACADPRCNPNNCSGCCTSYGSCEAGSSTLACGAGGMQCFDCPAVQTCSNGACVTGAGGGGGGTGGGGGGGGGTVACGPANCAGCCSANKCKLGNDSPVFCGHGGAQCIQCPSYRQSCSSAGECVTTCTTANCGTGCCAFGLCLPGTDNQFCNYGGYLCLECVAPKYCGPTQMCI